VRNLATPEDDQIHKTLFKLGVFNMMVHVVARHKDPAVKQNALRVLLDLASAALSSPSTSPVKPAGPSSSNTAAAGASSDKAKSDKANEYTARNAVDRLVKRGLPAVLLKLLHKDAPVALQTRAIMVSLLCSFLLAPSARRRLMADAGKAFGGHVILAQLTHCLGLAVLFRMSIQCCRAWSVISGSW
jgi:hypothetical protein